MQGSIPQWRIFAFEAKVMSIRSFSHEESGYMSAYTVPLLCLKKDKIQKTRKQQLITDCIAGH